MKAEGLDRILFFKVGKFYELYHMDAEVGVRELGFTYMKGDYCHSGFPEQSYDRMVTSLVAKGYKVNDFHFTSTGTRNLSFSLDRWPESNKLKHQKRTRNG